MLKDNKCESNSHFGIGVTDSGTVATLIGNQCIQNNSSGIIFENGAAGDVNDNICSENTWSGIAVRGEKTTAVIAANKCDNNGAWGIISWAGAKSDIREDNITTGNGRAGVKRREKSEIACSVLLAAGE